MGVGDEGDEDDDEMVAKNYGRYLSRAFLFESADLFMGVKFTCHRRRGCGEVVKHLFILIEFIPHRFQLAD